ncbi:heterokaryon incompatibility protein-domain-containing protein [Aspergillus spectabilis]
MPFEYHPLDPAKQEIRLLTILPRTDFESEINCTLRTVSLKQEASFEALSYVWGGLEATEHVFIDGHMFQITPSLASALRYLRLGDRPRVIWADYVCMNQTDPEEKSNQLPLMSLIYSICTRVLCFLGPDTPRIEMAITWIEKNVHGKEEQRTGARLTRDSEALSSIGKKDNGGVSLERYLGLRDLLALPYWTRMWTYQEFQLAKDEPLCLLGNFEFKTSDLSKMALARLVTEEVTVTDPSRDVQEREGGDQETLNLPDLSILDSAGFELFLLHIRDRGQYQNKQTNLLSILTWKTAQHCCTDKRDKIYALYGMVPAAQDAFPADYTKPVGEVMKEATTYMIEEEVGLAILNWFPCRGDSIANHELPSWVPGYNENFSSGKGVQQIVVKTERSAIRRDCEEQPYVSRDLSTLHAWGSKLGTCQVVFQFGSNVREVAGQIIQLVGSIPEALIATTWKSSTLPERLLQAAFSHYASDTELPLDEMLEALHAFSTDSVPPGAWRQQPWRSVECQLSGACHRTLFLIDHECGRGFGVSGVAVSDGDEVFLANDASHPLILRKAGWDMNPDLDDDNEGDPLYRLVGQAFVDGLAESQTPNMFCDYVKELDLKEMLIV